MEEKDEDVFFPLLLLLRKHYMGAAVWEMGREGVVHTSKKGGIPRREGNAVSGGGGGGRGNFFFLGNEGMVGEKIPLFGPFKRKGGGNNPPSSS